jgi:WS/DGAT/MGAT family acyltransferase
MSLQHEQMASVDTAWLHMDRPTNLMVITSVMTFEGSLNIDKVRVLLEERLLRFDRFRQRVVESSLPLTTPTWELDPHFDIHSHLHHIALPAPGDQAQLQQLVGDIMSQGLDHSKPLWQFYVVDNYRGGSAVISRIHHCIADGIALTRLMLSLTDETPDTVWIEEESTAPARKRRGPLGRLFSPALLAAKSAWHLTETVWSESLELMRHPDHALDLAKLGASSAARLARMTLYAPDPPTIYKGNLGTVKRAAWSQPFPLAEVKAVGKAAGATINDTLVTAISGGLRQFLISRGDDVTDLNIRAYIPVNLRPLKAPISLGNQFGLVFLSMPLGIDDPVERLQEVKRRMDEIKSSPEALVAWAVLATMGRLPTDVEKLGLDFYGMKASAVLTNVPGPRQALYMTGVKMRAALGWVPQSADIGLGLSIFSYDGRVIIGVNTDADNVPEPQGIVELIEAEYARLRDQLQPTEAAATRRCQAQTQLGRQCRNTAQPGSAFCHRHG